MSSKFPRALTGPIPRKLLEDFFQGHHTVTGTSKAVYPGHRIERAGNWGWLRFVGVTPVGGVWIVACQDYDRSRSELKRDWVEPANGLRMSSLHRQ